MHVRAVLNFLNRMQNLGYMCVSGERLHSFHLISKEVHDFPTVNHLWMIETKDIFNFENVIIL